jgi:hypothetical protein
VSERMDAELADVAYDEAEGAAESFDVADEFEGAEMLEEEEFDAAADFDVGDEGLEDWEAGAEGLYDEFEEEEALFDEDYGEEEFADYGEEADFEDAMALALGAEDTDEFFRRIGGFVRRAAGVARRVAPVVGQIARTVAPIARALPIPQAQAIAPILGLLGQLRAEGASDEEAMDAFAELAAYDESVLPVVAGMMARSVVGPRAARLPVAVRRRLVRNLTATARTLVRRAGPAGARALPRVARSVRRAGAVRRTPPTQRARVVQRTVARVARSPRLIRRLARPSPAARQRVRRVIRRVGGPRRWRRYGVGVGPGVGPGFGPGRTLVIRGPVRISITR